MKSKLAAGFSSLFVLCLSLSLPAQKKSLHGKYEVISKTENGKSVYYIAAYKGKPVSAEKFESVDYRTQTFNTFAIVKKNGKWGVVDQEGKTLIPFNYDQFSGFMDSTDHSRWGYWQKAPLKETKGYFIVRNDNKFGSIDQDGKTLIPCEYQGLEMWMSRKVAYAQKDWKWGLLGFDGRIIFPFEYQVFSRFSYKPFILQDKNGKYGSLNEEGKVRIPFMYDAVSADDNDLLKKNGHWGSVSFNGLEEIPFIYDSITPMIDFNHYAFQKNNKWFIATVDDSVIPVPGMSYDNVVSNLIIEDPEFAAKTGSKWQLLSFSGKKPLDLDCDEVKPCRGPYFLFVKSGKAGLYSPKGEVIIPPLYDSISATDLETADIATRVYKGGKCGMFTFKDKKETLPCIFDNVDYDAFIDNHYTGSKFYAVTKDYQHKIYIGDPHLKSFGTALNLDNFMLVNETETSLRDWLWYAYSKAGGESLNPSDLPDTNALNPLCRIAFRLAGNNEEPCDYMKITPSFSRESVTIRCPKGRLKELEAILDYPVTGVTFAQVNNFCEWVNVRLAESNYYDGVSVQISLPDVNEWEYTARKGFRPSEIPSDRHDSVNDKGCMLFRYRADKGCPFYDNMIKLRGNETVKIWDFSPDMDGIYNLFGNVAEMTSAEGIAKGGSYLHYAAGSGPGNTIEYTGAQPWLGFRYIMVFKQL